ncbi:hypothetical protein Tco_0391255 [Tanacetum coccineum]
MRSHSRQLRENPVIQRLEALCLRCSTVKGVNSTSRLLSLVSILGLSSECPDAGYLSRWLMASGKNGDDGDLLLFRDGPGACDISAGTLRLFISWECSRPVAGVKVSLVRYVVGE